VEPARTPACFPKSPTVALASATAARNVYGSTVSPACAKSVSTTVRPAIVLPSPSPHAVGNRYQPWPLGKMRDIEVRVVAAADVAAGSSAHAMGATSGA
jgi:hypothetical protein